MRQGHVSIRCRSSIRSFYWNNEFCDSFSKLLQRITIPLPHKKKSPRYYHHPTFLNLMKEAIIQAHLLSSPFWKGSLEAVKWYLSLYLLDQNNSAGEGKSCQMFIKLGCFSPSPYIHYVSLGIYLNTIVLQESTFDPQLHISRYFMAQSVKSNKPFSFRWIRLLHDPRSNSQIH